ncbi:MAG: response regulator [gamma proteobacterium symbiont of Taylorina sp.]|nr:response regulator [gamma proteobacterium symbiont of Taylorina sp.]
MAKSLTILAIDDTAENLGILENILEAEQFKVLVATSGERGLEIAQKQIPNMILLDIMMPGWNGFETAEFIRQIPQLKHVPILFLSALDDVESKVKALQAGGVDYISKPFQRLELMARINTHIELSQLRSHLQEQVDKQTYELRHAYEDSLSLLSVASEYRDYETGMHNNRLGLYSALLASKLGWSESQCHTILFAAPLHDVGKIGIPDKILHKEGPLDKDEWVIMQSHSAIGYKILNKKSEYNQLLKMAAEIACGHHEAFDGSGYPQGEKGLSIPISARITSLCDVYDALRSKRPYKKSFSHEQTLNIILTGDQRTQPCQFDPQVLEQFKYHEQMFNQIFETMSDSSNISLMKQYQKLEQQW